MARKNKMAAQAAEVEALVAQGETYGEAMLEVHGDAPDDFDDPRLADEDGTLLSERLAPKSVVKTGYKRAYQDRAEARGARDKASKRGCGDWLQRELQAETIVSGAFDFTRFVAILDANGVDHSRWATAGNGWQGRFRMSGSIVLRGRVGKSGVFRTPDSEHNVARLAEQGDAEAAAFLAKWSN
jgi:hypothetical protein